MSDSQRPNPPAPSFEVPDLELEPAPRLPRPAAPTPAAARPARAPSASSAQDQLFGSSFDFDDDGDDLDAFELVRTAQPNFQAVAERAPSPAAAKRPRPAAADAEPSWPSARVLEVSELVIDPREVAILADYGEPPQSAPGTLAYAYRVFTRQRELKQQLQPIARECERALAEREQTLAEFAQATRASIEQLPEFRRFFAPLAELEQRAAQRGQALGAIHAQLGAETGQLDEERAQLAHQIEAEQRLERDAQSQYDAREANAKRADAKLKRVQIEARAVTQIAEQKLGPRGGPIPDAEAAQLADLRQRAEALQPEVAQARAELEQAKLTLTQHQARLAALRQGDRQITRKKQALASAYEQELAARAQGVSESQSEQRVALAELARAILAARGAVAIPDDWLERVRSACERADRLVLRAEMQRRAIAAYDAERARQGLRLAGTALGLLLLLFVFKLIF